MKFDISVGFKRLRVLFLLLSFINIVDLEIAGSAICYPCHDINLVSLYNSHVV
jgi:hypothetical protein